MCVCKCVSARVCVGVVWMVYACFVFDIILYYLFYIIVVCDWLLEKSDRPNKAKLYLVNLCNLGWWISVETYQLSEGKHRRLHPKSHPTVHQRQWIRPGFCPHEVIGSCRSLRLGHQHHEFLCGLLWSASEASGARSRQRAAASSRGEAPGRPDQDHDAGSRARQVDARVSGRGRRKA